MSVVAQLNGVERTYSNGVKAVGPLDLELREGEFVSLLGPSGCGKSTALRLIATLLAPTAGGIEWPRGKPPLGFVFQDATLMPWATARDNVRLPLDLAKVPRHEALMRADAALDRVGLAGFGGAYPRELSGGMRMRVSIARALVAKPKLLLMDEPFAALDEMTRHELNDDLLRLWRADDLTIVFVTHSVYESTYLSTRTLVLTPRPGTIAADIAFPRRPAADPSYRFSPEFADHASKVTSALRNAMKIAA